MAAKPKVKVNKKASEKAKRKERQNIEAKRSGEVDQKKQREELRKLKAQEKARDKRAKELEKAIVKREREREKLEKAKQKAAEEREKYERMRAKNDKVEELNRIKQLEEVKKAELELEIQEEAAEQRRLAREAKKKSKEEKQEKAERAKETKAEKEAKQALEKEAKQVLEKEAKPKREKKARPDRKSAFAKLKPINPKKKRDHEELTDIERIAAYLITVVDISIDVMEWAIRRLAITFLRRFYTLRLAIHRNVRTIIKDGALIVVAILILLVCFTSITDYQYSYNGKVLGIVREQSDVLDILDLVSDELSLEYDSNIRINPDRDISFMTVFSMNQDIDDQDTILNKLTHMGQIQTQAYAITVNGESIAVLESERHAQNVLINIQQLYLDPDEEYSEVGFSEDVKIEEVSVKLSDITNVEDATQYIKSGAVQAKEYTVVPGDTLYGIAEKNGITYAELKAMNPNIKDTMVIHSGDKFKVQVEVPLVTVRTVGISTFAEAIPYETEYKESSAYYVGESITTKAGKNGRMSVTAELIKENGVAVGREDISSFVLVEPTTRIVVKGTKPTPPKQGTGTFKKPVNYRINSGYGMRNGRMHKGVDMACPVGTAVRAADGGTVIMSKWYGDYGYCVEIDHGGGYVTLYGHNSKLAVKVGEKVYQGQIIAYSGNTGRSTGPHCHFEIMYLGKNVNPAKYL